ncbi:hypothetical protein [Streptomyces bullii]|uniref:Uncharacterized protein n=1 Tax=Streptomyces bullii TaxID=349910 RepID=A0ABW0V3H2_9ACTN
MVTTVARRIRIGRPDGKTGGWAAGAVDAAAAGEATAAAPSAAAPVSKRRRLADRDSRPTGSGGVDLACSASADSALGPGSVTAADLSNWLSRSGVFRIGLDPAW